ncbi:MAG: hypothetical protein WDN25_00980 [Acetobacteraceae bacterium]
MTLDLSDCGFAGPALPAPFVHHDLAACLRQNGVLPDAADATLQRRWTVLRRDLRLVGATAGPQRVASLVVAPLARQLGYAPPVRQEDEATREGEESGGWLMAAPGGAFLRAWTFAVDTDLDAPHRSGRAYRFSPMRSAQRVLLARGERLGLLTDGAVLRLLLCDPARPDSYIEVPLAGAAGWRARDLAPDSFRLVLALAAPAGMAALPALLEAARLAQTRVTKALRGQARAAVEGFLQAVLDHPANASARGQGMAAEALWQEGLILVYRLLFILKLESAADPARAFGFAATPLWRGALSPNRALGPLVRRRLDQGHDTGRMLEDGLRLLFRLCRDGLSCSELSLAPLGGALFGGQATPLLDRLHWGEHGVALLLDRLLWSTPKGRARERVHYGSLDVEELGRVYEALLELEPGLAVAPMARVRRARLEVVLPVCEAQIWRDAGPGPARGPGTQVRWVEDIPAGRFFLRAGIGRKATGSYYTPHAFVRFLVQAALAPQVARLSPDDDPQPGAILGLKVLDPATGSGHFLVEACRFLGEALYAACRACDDLAAAADAPERAAMLRGRIAQLPDPDGLLLAYLPSRAHAGGVSQSRALAICRRLVAVHCLYGVDSNRLAVELAKLSLWLESYADGLPLTFLDHRLVQGDSLSGASFEALAHLPVGGGPLDPLLAADVSRRLGEALAAALRDVRALQASVGADAAALVAKQAAKARLDAGLRPLRWLACAWSGAVMLGTREADDEWLALARSVAASGAWPVALTGRQSAMLAAGERALPWDLAFPEVFLRAGNSGFDAVLGNPPWDVVQPKAAEFLAAYDLSVLDDAKAPAVRRRLLAEPSIGCAWRAYVEGFARQHRVVARLYRHQLHGTQGVAMGGKLDLYRVFAERMLRLLGSTGAVGMVVPSAFHANEGATAIRRLYLEQTRMEWCLSFENRLGIFDIHASSKFALVVAHRPGPTQVLRCAFYLTAFEQIEESQRLLTYDRDFIRLSGGACETLLELRSAEDLVLARRMFRTRRGFAEWMGTRGIVLSREMHMTDDAGRFRPVGDAPDAFAVHEGKTIHQFTDRWDAAPRHMIRIGDLADRARTLEAARHFRAACREVARSTDERTAIAAMLPPGVVCGHTLSVERRPGQRASADALVLVAVMNSFPFDWLLRQRAAAHVSLYILVDLPAPDLTAAAASFLAHGCLRLCCNHAGFAPLWQEQVGNAWHEASPPRSWPAVAAPEDRWRLRAAMDAVVADAYGLERDHYARILGSFSHKSFPAAAGLCLAAFDDLRRTGRDMFCANNDPYAPRAAGFGTTPDSRVSQGQTKQRGKPWPRMRKPSTIS